MQDGWQGSKKGDHKAAVFNIWVTPCLIDARFIVVSFWDQRHVKQIWFNFKFRNRIFIMQSLSSQPWPGAFRRFGTSEWAVLPQWTRWVRLCRGKTDPINQNGICVKAEITPLCQRQKLQGKRTTDWVSSTSSWMAPWISIFQLAEAVHTMTNAVDQRCWSCLVMMSWGLQKRWLVHVGNQ